MVRGALLVIALAAAGLTSASAAQATVNDAPPSLVDAEFTPSAIDVTAADVVVKADLLIAPQEFGLSRGQLVWVGPSGQSLVVPFDHDRQIPTSTWEELYSVPTTFARGTEAGTWHLDSVSMWNSLDVMGTAEPWLFEFLGIPTELVVTSGPVDAPPAPTGVTALAGDGRATVSWAPASAPAGTVIGYRVTASPGGTTTQTAITSEYPPAVPTTADVSGLSNGVDYTFTVVTLTAGGASAPSLPSAPVAPRPVVTAAGGTVDEGDALVGPQAASTIRLSAPSALPVTVTVATTGGSATPGEDYVKASARVTIPAGATEAAGPNVRIVGDERYERQETFQLRLSGARNAVVRQAPPGTVTIVDDDPLPVLTVADAEVIEGDDQAAALVFRVTLSQASGAPASVAWATVRSGTATAGVDYTPTSGRAVIPAGATTTTIRVPVLPDRAAEPDELVLLRLTGAKQTLLSRIGAVGMIVDDDPVG